MRVHKSFKFDPNPKWAWEFKTLLLDRLSEPITGRNLMPDTYKMDGCLFIWRKEALMKNLENRVILNSTIGFKISEIESLDIDTHEDLDYARYIYKKLF